MSDYFSKVEILGSITKCSTEEESRAKDYFYARLMYKDIGSPAKFVNVYAWENHKQKFASLSLKKGDTIKVVGELAMIEKQDTVSYAVRATDVQLLSEQEQVQSRAPY